VFEAFKIDFFASPVHQQKHPGPLVIWQACFFVRNWTESYREHA